MRFHEGGAVWPGWGVVLSLLCGYGVKNYIALFYGRRERVGADMDGGIEKRYPTPKGTVAAACWVLYITRSSQQTGHSYPIIKTIIFADRSDTLPFLWLNRRANVNLLNQIRHRCANKNAI